MARVMRSLDGDRDVVQVGNHCLRIRSLVTRYGRFGHHRVHDTVEMRFPGVRRSLDQGASCSLEQPGFPQRAQRPHNRRGIAQYHACAVSTQRGFIVRLRHKGMAGERMLLATLVDHLDADLFIKQLVCSADPFRRAVRHDVDMR